MTEILINYKTFSRKVEKQRLDFWKKKIFKKGRFLKHKKYS